MNYNNRKICGLINLHSMTPNLRCPRKDTKAIRDCACDGCELFELYLNFRTRSLEMKNNELEKCLRE